MRGISIKNSERRKFKAILMRNRREALSEIPKEYFKKIHREMETINYFELEVPEYMMNQRKKAFNQLYLRILPRQQVIIETTSSNGEITKERFVLIEQSRDKSKNSGVKKYKGFSMEHTLKGKRCVFSNEIMQLKKTGDEHIQDGLLDKFEQETKWTVNYVDPNSRTEVSSAMDIINVDMFNSFEKSNILSESLIYEKDITSNVEEGRALYLSVRYENMKTYDGNNKVIATNNIINTITDALPMNIRHIKAYHFSGVSNRFGIKYIFTMKDGSLVERITTFANVINKKITCDKITLAYETGNIIEKTNVKYVQIDTSGGDENWYNFLVETVDKFNSIVFFDSYCKSISIYSRDSLGKKAPYLLSYDTNIISANVSDNNERPNALRVKSSKASISEENIYGGDVIFNYRWYIENNIMSDELQNEWNRYEDVLSVIQEEWLVLKNNKMDNVSRKTAIDSEIKSLDERIKVARQLLASYMASNDSKNQEIIAQELKELENRLNECNRIRGNYITNIAELEEDMAIISNNIKLENCKDINGNIFSELSLEELNDIYEEKAFDDDYYTTSYGLLNEAKRQLELMQKPTIDFKLNTVDLTKVMRQSPDKILIFGDIFKLEGDKELIKDLGEDVIRFVGYNYYPTEDKIGDMLFSSKEKMIDIKNRLSDIGKKTSENTNIVNKYKQTFDDSMLSNNFVKSLIDGTLDSASTTIKGRSTSNLIDISSAGIFLYNTDDINKAIAITSSLIVLTEDGFNSSKIAVNSSAIVADVLAGNMVYGQKLTATSDTGVFEITGNGLTIYDEHKRVRVRLGMYEIGGSMKAGLTLYSKDGGEMVISEDGLISHMQFVDRDSVDSGSPMTTTYRVPDGVSEIRQIMMYLKLDSFKSYSKGVSGGGYSNVETASTTQDGGSSIITETSDETGEHNHTTMIVGGSGSGDIKDTLCLCKDDNGNSIPVMLGMDNRYGRLNIKTFSQDGKHRHQLRFTLPNHRHKFSINLEIPEHNHDQILGCFDTNRYASNVSVYINNNLAYNNINTSRDLDITRWIRMGVNEIKIYSETLGKIIINIYGKQFARY